MMDRLGSLGDEDRVHDPILPRPAGDPSRTQLGLDDGALGDYVSPDKLSEV